MSLDDSYGPYEGRRGSGGRAGFRVGLAAGVIMVCVHLVLLLINRGDNRGDLLAWGLQLVVYYFAGRTAAEQHHSAQQEELDHLRGVSAAGVGAALVCSAIVWVYIIVRGVVRDALGVYVIVGPICLFFIIILDVLIAMGLGGAGGRAVAKKYETF